MSAPLAERMRPKSLEEYVGQSHLLGDKGVLKEAIRQKFMPSMILWGPPGVGKTTLALLLAEALNRPFYQLSAIAAGVKDVRETIEKAEKDKFFSRENPILFIDEIHRFNKAQQDALLGAVEKGTFTLIGATTENPSFEVIAALRSRCQIYVLQSLSEQQLIGMIDAAIANDEVLKTKTINIVSYDALLRFSGGDGRKLYNILELATAGSNEITIDNELIINKLQQNIANYDKSGEQHYDIISAFIKSIRGSHPDAALYYLACMLEGGEDLKFIARRMLILAAEDIGLANPNALLMAQTCMEAVRNVGMPESRIILSQCVIYLATSPKSNTAYKAIEKALAEVRQNGVQSVPLHLRNAPSQLMKDLDYGKNYQYAHDFEGNFVKISFLPATLEGKKFYEAGSNANEEKIKKWLDERWGN
jgi:putative ATPase